VPIELRSSPLRRRRADAEAASKSSRLAARGAVLALGVALAGLAGCASRAPVPAPAPTPTSTDAPLPEVAGGGAAPAATERPRLRRHAVVAAHPLAADAAAALLDAGGNALDAAIAAQLVLAVVEPQSSGLGGGAFLLHWDAREVAAWDGRETAPQSATPDRFLRADGTPWPLAVAVASGRAVGVPGLVPMLQAAHRAHGRLPWARLFEPAIALAEQGFAVGPRLHALLQAELKGTGALARDAQARAHFLDAEGRPWPVGHRLRNPALAAVLRTLARDGARAMTAGAIAEDIVRRVNAHGALPAAGMTADDLARYRPQRRAPLCADWTERWRVCGMPPPSSGPLAVMQALALLDRLDRRDRLEPAERTDRTDRSAAPAAPPDAAWLHRFTEAQRLAFADRNRHVGDPDFVAAPGGRWERLLDPAYLDARAALVGPRSLRQAPAGDPTAASPVALAAPMAAPEGGTSHVSVVDGDGRAVALTTSIEAMFGARLMSDGGSGLPGGFLLNNQLTDFALQPRDAEGREVANRVQPGKRPRSSMSPVFVFDRRDGTLVAVAGSALGAHIIPAVARTLVASLQWGLHPQDAVAQPNVSALNGPTLLEAGRFDAAVVQALRERGHEVIEQPLPTGLGLLVRRDGVWHGGADPRREGVVRGR
jgi:gamma-glutamyltranspeptidase/glutathione hydrolase